MEVGSRGKSINIVSAVFTQHLPEVPPAPPVLLFCWSWEGSQLWQGRGCTKLLVFLLLLLNITKMPWIVLRLSHACCSCTSLTPKQVAAAISQHPEPPQGEVGLRVGGLYPHTKAPALAQSQEGETFPRNKGHKSASLLLWSSHLKFPRTGMIRMRPELHHSAFAFLLVLSFPACNTLLQQHGSSRWA